MRMLANIFWLGTKELRSFFRDWVLLGLVTYSFSLAIMAQAQSSSQELHNASLAVVDEDHSQLSRRIARAFLLPDLPSIDANEITDKGYVNQRAAIAARQREIALLYAAEPGPEVIVLETAGAPAA